MDLSRRTLYTARRATGKNDGAPELTRGPMPQNQAGKEEQDMKRSRMFLLSALLAATGRNRLTWPASIPTWFR
jgi:hypothetical protein